MQFGAVQGMRGPRLRFLRSENKRCGRFVPQVIVFIWSGFVRLFLCAFKGETAMRAKDQVLAAFCPSCSSQARVDTPHAVHSCDVLHATTLCRASKPNPMLQNPSPCSSVAAFAVAQTNCDAHAKRSRRRPDRRHTKVCSRERCPKHWCTLLLLRKGW